MKKKMKRMYHIFLVVVLLFMYFLFDNALEEYLDYYVFGFWNDIFFAISKITYLLLSSLLIVKIVKPQISTTKAYAFIIVYAVAWIVIRFYLIGTIYA